MIDQNLADTLNKALDLAKQGVIAGFETVRQAAPYVWSLAKRQVFLDGVECAIFAILTVILGIWSIPKMWRWVEDNDELLILPVLGTAGIVTSCIFLLVTAIDYIANPGYWTIQRILEMIKH